MEMMPQQGLLKPHEAVPPVIEGQDDELEEVTELAEYAAKEYGFELPRAGTPALRRLLQTCIDYAERVAYQAISPMMQVDERRREKSDQIRRHLHNELCKMLAGKAHQELSRQELNRISNFAVSVAGKDEYIDTF